MLNCSLGGVMLTWPNQDDWMNVTKNFEHDQKPMNLWTLTLKHDQKYNKCSDNDKP